MGILKLFVVTDISILLFVSGKVYCTGEAENCKRNLHVYAFLNCNIYSYTLILPLYSRKDALARMNKIKHDFFERFRQYDKQLKK